MRIVHINLFDQQGGAARIANQLADYMRSKGNIVHQFAFVVSQPDEFTIPIGRPSENSMKAFQAMESQRGMVDFFAPYLFEVLAHPVFKEADVVHLHCINGGYFSYFLLPFLAQKPLLWTLHDTLAFTAHCLYPHLCQNWQTAYCAKCPLDGERPAPLNRPLVQQIKERIINTVQIRLVAPSHWIEDMVKKSIFCQKETKMIYNGVDTMVYKPYDKKEARKKWNLPTDSFIVMFAAHGGLANAMKGGGYMVEAMKILQKKYPQIVFLEVGGKHPELLQGLQLKSYAFPYIEEEAAMAELYSTSDVFVSTSMTESFGLTVCEAMACGVPVVSFATGGLREIIEDKKTGCLISLKDVDGLAQAIGEALEHPVELKQIGHSARERVEQMFSVNGFCREYEKVYGELHA